MGKASRRRPRTDTDVLNSGWPLLLHPNRLLSTVCLPIATFDDGLAYLVDQLVKAMRVTHGMGVAAPQAGEPCRVFVWTQDAKEWAIVNPEIVEADGEQIGREECLSMPGVDLQVARSMRVVMRGFDIEGTEMEREGTGLTARTWQHEIDHLDGVMMLDRVNRQLRRNAERQWEKRRVPHSGTRARTRVSA